MTMINSAATLSRENARGADGKFGHQTHAEATGVSLSAPAPARASRFTSPARMAANAVIAELHSRQVEVEHYYDQLTAKAVAEEVLEQYPTAARISLELVGYDDGEFHKPQALYDAEGNELEEDVSTIDLENETTNVDEMLSQCDLERRSSAAGFRQVAHDETATTATTSTSPPQPLPSRSRRRSSPTPPTGCSPANSRPTSWSGLPGASRRTSSC
jgi:hypothetical protein